MSTIRTLLRAATVAVGSSTALVVGGLVGTAHADSAQPAPAPNSGDQVNIADVDPNQVLQHIAMALSAQSPAAPSAQSPAPPPAAGAAIKVPQLAPATVPGATTAMPGSTSLLPGATAATPAATTATPGLSGGIPGLTPAYPAPAAAAPAPGSAGLTPSAQFDLPQMPFLPVPLPQQVSLPRDLVSLAPGGVPVPQTVNQPTTAVSPVPATAPVTSPNPLLLPLSGLP
jgi:hypothetical protein